MEFYQDIGGKEMQNYEILKDYQRIVQKTLNQWRHQYQLEIQLLGFVPAEDPTTSEDVITLLVKRWKDDVPF